jgi:hypothetical protein
LKTETWKDVFLEFSLLSHLTVCRFEECGYSPNGLSARYFVDFPEGRFISVNFPGIASDVWDQPTAIRTRHRPYLHFLGNLQRQVNANRKARLIAPYDAARYEYLVLEPVEKI